MHSVGVTEEDATDSILLWKERKQLKVEDIEYALFLKGTYYSPSQPHIFIRELYFSMNHSSK